MEDKIERIIELRAPRSRVWLALVNHEQFGIWFRCKLENPFVVGEVTKGRITEKGYEHMVWESLTRSIEPEDYFAFSWPAEEGEDFDFSSDLQTLVEFRLEDIASGTRLTLCESGFAQLPANMRSEYFRQNSGGWDHQVHNITAYVEK